MIAVFKRELSAYYKGMVGYLFAAFLLLFAGIYVTGLNLSGTYANFEYALDSMAFIYLIAVPILTMRSVAEEKRQKTDQLLYSLPIPLGRVILGKYLAMVCVLLLPIGVMALYPLILSRFGAVAFPAAYSALFAFFLLGTSLIAIGLFISAITENQVVAAVITLSALLLLYFGPALASLLSSAAIVSFAAIAVIILLFAIILYFLSRNILVAVLAAVVGEGAIFSLYNHQSAAFYGLFKEVINQLSLFERFYTFVYGVFDLTAVVYFLSITCVFLFLSVQAMEKRRWSE